MEEDAVSNEIFISYSHDSAAHAERVRSVADRLRQDGLTSAIDQYEASPDRGWPRWIQDHILTSRKIVVVCTDTYRERFEGAAPAGVGRGASFEGLLLSQTLYNASGSNPRIRPVVFDGADAMRVVPLALQAFTTYALPSQYEELYRWLTDQVRRPPSVGSKRILGTD